MQPLIGSKTQLADLLGLSERRITDLITAGVMPARGPAGFDLGASVRGYIAFLKSMPSNLTDERARLTKSQADMAELKLLERTGELVERAAVADLQFRQGRQIRDAFLNVPDRVAGIVAAETDQHRIHTILTKEILQVLGGLSDAKTTTTTEAR